VARDEPFERLLADLGVADAPVERLIHRLDHRVAVPQRLERAGDDLLVPRRELIGDELDLLVVRPFEVPRRADQRETAGLHGGGDLVVAGDQAQLTRR
jgi:hypothetical protein